MRRPGASAALRAALALGIAVASLAPPRVRVFVYDLPRSFNLDLLDADIRRGRNVLCDNDCSWSQWAAEVMVHAWLLQHPARTLDPEEADLFFVPYYAALDRRISSSTDLPLASPAHDALFAAVAHRRYDGWANATELPERWWARRGGQDHVLVLAKEPDQHCALCMVTIFPSSAGASSTMRPDDGREQPAPPPDWLQLHGAVGAQLLATELPPGADTARHVVLPYPQLGPHWAALARRPPHEPAAAPAAPPSTRPVLAFFYGAVHGPFGKRFRGVLFRALRAEPDCVFVRFANRLGVANGSVHARTPSWRERMGQSVFCPVVGGDTRNSRRLYAAVLSGCVPVLLGSPHELLLPFGWALAPHEWTLSVPDARLMAGQLVGDLRAVPAKQLRRLRAGVRRARQLTWWEWPDAHGVGEARFPHALGRLSGQMHELARALPDRARARPACAAAAAAAEQRKATSLQHSGSTADRDAGGRQPDHAAAGARALEPPRPTTASDGETGEPCLTGGVYGGAFDVLWAELERRALALKPKSASRSTGP